MDDLIARRRHNAALAGLKRTGLYHSIPLPDGRVLEGAMSLELQRQRVASYQLPARLDGKRVLDIGPWDGFFTFEMERRGAEVTAVDYVDLDTFRAVHRAVGSRAQYHQMEVYELDPARLGMFDVVLCLGLLYHAKYPLLALEKICGVTRDLCIIDTFVIDAAGPVSPIPYMEFYERDELGGELDNWTGPTIDAVCALARAAGFASATKLGTIDSTAQVAASRKWRDLPPDATPPVKVNALTAGTHRGRCFYSGKEEYIVLWCEWGSEDAPSLDLVFPEVDGLGVAPLACKKSEYGLNIAFRVPPGLAPGGHEARVKIGRGAWSESKEFFFDLPPVEGAPALTSIQDGVSWRSDEVDWSGDGWLTLWVEGLSAEADCGNLRVEIDGVPHLPDSVDPPRGQVNVKLRPLIRPGEWDVRILHRGLVSDSRKLRVVGDPPPVRGLDDL